MKTLLCLMVIGFCVLAGFATNYVALRYGWGLEVQSWPVVIGCWLTSFVLTFVTAAAGEVMKKD